MWKTLEQKFYLVKLQKNTEDFGAKSGYPFSIPKGDEEKMLVLGKQEGY